MWVEKYHVIDKINHGDTHGFLDINAGITIADKVSEKVVRLIYSYSYNHSHAYMLATSVSRQVSNLSWEILRVNLRLSLWSTAAGKRRLLASRPQTARDTLGNL